MSGASLNFITDFPFMAEGPRIHSINVSGIREVMFYGQIVTTGIFKEPVAGLIEPNALGLKGDFQADLTVHGGPEKAVYFFIPMSITSHGKRFLA